MDGPQYDLSFKAATVSRTADPIAIQEAALREMAAADPNFDVHVTPLTESKEIWWRISVVFPGYTRQLRLVDARLRDRRWRQLNAVARFVCRSCGRERQLKINLSGVDPELLTTKGE